MTAHAFKGSHANSSAFEYHPPAREEEKTHQYALTAWIYGYEWVMETVVSWYEAFVVSEQKEKSYQSLIKQETKTVWLCMIGH